MFRRPAIFTSFPNLIAAESTRHGGVSPAPYASLNLGKGTDDAPENVAENRRRFCQALGFEPGQLNQPPRLQFQIFVDRIQRQVLRLGEHGLDAVLAQFGHHFLFFLQELPCHRLAVHVGGGVYFFGGSLRISVFSKNTTTSRCDG
jgi:hypothetical protein